ncbi:MAG TPA: SWIM zinc finger family protein [Chloroflexota bacterium]|nr:SWIM zinc finger family protein [Chloroflexota bacterium]
MKGKLASTWWGERWIAALSRLIEAPRLSQGHWHARSGRVVRLNLVHGAVGGGRRPSTVVARLQGGRATPRTVTIRLATLSDAAWEQAIEAMAARAIFGAQLLTGELPPAIEEVFAAAGASLFPRDGREVSFTCTCSDSCKAPCKHIAAVCYVLAERFDADPWLLFELRGRSRAQLTAALRQRRRAVAPLPFPSPSLRDPDSAGAAAVESPSAFWSSPDSLPAIPTGGASDGAAQQGPAPAGPTARPVLPFDDGRAPPFWPDRAAFRVVMVAAYSAIAAEATPPDE